MLTHHLGRTDANEVIKAAEYDDEVVELPERGKPDGDEVDRRHEVEESQHQASFRENRDAPITNSRQ